MAGNSEQTFGDRLQRGRTMQSKIAGFTPAFDPSDTSLTAANFDTFLDLVESKNNAVATKETLNGNAIGTHKLLYDLIKNRTLRVVDTVSGNEAWDKYLPKIQEAARLVRNSRPRKTPPPPPPGTPPKTPRKTGQQSYGDLDMGFEKVIEATKLVPGYMPPVTSNLQLTQLATLLGDYRTANAAVATTEAELDRARDERLTIYNGEPGSLRTKMKAIKKATGGQYGRDSSQFTSVNSIKL